MLINANMGKMCHVLDAIWEQLQDKHSPPQQSGVEEPRRNSSKRGRSVSPPRSDYGDDDDCPSGNERAKPGKTAPTTGCASSDVEDDCLSINAHDEQDNKSDLIHHPSQHQADTGLPMRHSKVYEIKATCEAIKPQLAGIVRKRFH